MLSEKSQRTQNGTMFVDLDWPLNASRRLSASAELLVLVDDQLEWVPLRSCSYCHFYFFFSDIYPRYIRVKKKMAIIQVVQRPTRWRCGMWLWLLMTYHSFFNLWDTYGTPLGKKIKFFYFPFSLKSSTRVSVVKAGLSPCKRWFECRCHPYGSSVT